MWIKEPDFYVRVPLPVGPVASNLKGEIFNILLYIHRGLMPCALSFPECPQGGVKSRHSRSKPV